MATTDRRGVSVSATDTAIAGDPNPGLAWKAPVLVATAGNITLSGLQTVDGVALAAGNRVLVWVQTDPRQNGIYDVSTGPWTRSIDLSSNDEIAAGLQVAVTAGTWAKASFGINTADPIVIGTTAITFAVRSLLKVGLTPIYGGIDKGLLYNNGGVLGNLATANSGVLITDSSGVPFISPTLTLAPTAGLTQGINITQSGSGTAPPPTGTFLTYDYNRVTIDDNIATPDQTPIFGFSVRMDQNKSAATGGGAFLAYQRVSGSAPAAVNDPASLTAYTSVESNYRGGTAMAPAGAVFGTSIYASLLGAGIHLNGLTGSEVNVQAVGAGSTLNIKYGWNIVALTSDAIQGTNYDSAYNVSSNSGAVGWKHAFTVSDSNGPKALDTTATIIATINSGTVAGGIDFSSYTISGAAWRSPGVTIAGGTGGGSLANETGITLTNGTVVGINVITGSGGGGAAIGTQTAHPLYLSAGNSIWAILSPTGAFKLSAYTQGAIVSDSAGSITSAALTNGQIIVGQTGAVPLAKTMTGDAGLSAAGLLTLATVNSNVGTFGSATQAPQFTVNGKGLITAASNVTITPAIGSITGLGTGVATALAIAIGSAGAPVLFNGAGGTPSSLTGTNISGTASSLTAGNATNTAITDDTSTNATMYVTWVTANTGNLPQKVTSTKLTFNPSTGVLSSTSFTGAGTGLTGTAASLTAGTASAVAVGGITGLGTGVATALAISVGSAGGPVTFNGALGTPSSGTVTNLTGTASININGTVGATTPAAGTFTAAIANSFVPNLSTVPSNGMYLPAANTLGWAINSAAELQLTSTALSPAADGGNSLGTTALGWQNLFANTGFVLNIENSDWVATHTTGILTVGTGDLRVTTAGTNAASVVTVGGTQTLTNKTLTSPTLTAPVLGSATATSINKVAITAPATSATLTLIDGTTLTGPAASGTAMTLGNTETVTGVKTFGSAGAVGRLKIAGTTSGAITLDATAVAGTGTLTLPAATDTLVGKATTDTLTNKTFDSAGTGNVLKVSGVTVSAGQYPSEPSNGSASAGNIGEYALGFADNVPITSTVPTNICSISLGAGEWDVQYIAYFVPAGTTTITYMNANINTASGTQNSLLGSYNQVYIGGSATPGIPLAVITPLYRVQLTGTTTLYGNATTQFAVSTMAVYGIMRARRR